MKQRQIDQELLSRVLQRLDEQMGNMPSSEGGGGKGGHSDRTGGLAFRHLIHPDDEKRGEQADIARRERDRIDGLQRAIVRSAKLGLSTAEDVARLDQILRRNDLSEKQLERLRSKGDNSGAGWCQSHIREPLLAQEAPRTPGSAMCRWCDDWVRALNDPEGPWRLEVAFPPIEMVRARIQGQSVERFIPKRTHLDAR